MALKPITSARTVFVSLYMILFNANKKATQDPIPLIRWADQKCEERSEQSVLPRWRRPFPSNFGFPHLQQLSMIAKMTKNNYLNACNALFITSADNRTVDRWSSKGRPIEQRCIFERNFPPPYCGTAITAMIAETTESISLQEETIVLWSPLKSSYCHLYERLRLSTWGSTKDAKKFGKDEHRLVEIDSAEENRATIARIKRNSGSASLIFILRDNWMNWQKCRLLWLGFQRAQQQWKSWKRKLHKYQQQLLPATTDTKDN